jgi:hypothetical protein
MNIKAKLIVLSDKLDRLGLTKDADLIDFLLKSSSEKKNLSEVLEEEVEEEAAG